MCPRSYRQSRDVLNAAPSPCDAGQAQFVPAGCARRRRLLPDLHQQHKRHPARYVFAIRDLGRLVDTDSLCVGHRRPGRGYRDRKRGPQSDTTIQHDFPSHCEPRGQAEKYRCRAARRRAGDGARNAAGCWLDRTLVGGAPPTRPTILAPSPKIRSPRPDTLSPPDLPRIAAPSIHARIAYITYITN